ncbi:MAG: NAD(P)H-dependent glycerol-3-phosphate dehydrogenase [Actinomycetota bacterium]|nr:NAD(P)H-dependent glycerol-3-phosphate dehydrogenase [Actinomycetota bacterium]
MKSKINITIIGAGSWGTTLSVILARRDYRVNLWTRSEITYNNIKKSRINERYTGNLYIPHNVEPFTVKKDGLLNSELIIFAVPSQFLRDIIVKFYDVLNENKKNIKCVLNVAKGFEVGTNLRLSQVMQQCLPEELKSLICVLSGPNIASEIASGLPGVSVAASKNKDLNKYIQKLMSGEKFRIYTNDDVTGVEIGGAVKNIIAIASGISDGLGYKANTKASIITRGLYELTKFGVKLGARAVTFSGVAGMGDLIATCISKKSRNRFFGEKIAGGEKAGKILKDMYMVAEGVKTTKAVFNISKEMEIDMPITECIYRIIYEGQSPAESVKKLMNRKFKSEVEDII